jgi:hypothetical protein
VKEATTMEPQMMPIVGWGVDRRIEDRPGYPREQERHVGYETLLDLPPYSETIPLKGLSGLLRRAAYRLPDWKARRWITLLVADRIDALESNLTPRKLLFAGGIGSLIAAGFAVKRMLR